MSSAIYQECVSQDEICPINTYISLATTDNQQCKEMPVNSLATHTITVTFLQSNDYHNQWCHYEIDISTQYKGHVKAKGHFKI